MAEVHVSIKNDASGNSIKFDNPSITPLPPGAGQPVAQVKDASGNNVKTSGQVTGTSVVFNSPG